MADNSLTSSTGNTNSASNAGRDLAGQDRNLASAQRDYGFNWRDAKKNWERSRAKLAGGYQARGMMRSGMYNRGQSEFSVDRTNNFGQLARAFNDQREGLGVQRANTDLGYFGGMVDSETQRSMDWANTAAALQDRIV